MAVNLVATLTMARANRRSLNVEGAYRHILTDLYGFAGTLIAGVVIVVWGFDRADAIASLVVVLLMLKAAGGAAAARRCASCSRRRPRTSTSTRCAGT